MDSAPLTLTDLDELDRLEREATQGMVQTEKRNDTFQVCVPYTGEHPSAKQWIATFPEHRNGDFELFVAARNRLPQLLALARIGVLAVAENEAAKAVPRGPVVEGMDLTTTQAWMLASEKLDAAIDAYKGGLPK